MLTTGLNQTWTWDEAMKKLTLAIPLIFVTLFLAGCGKPQGQIDAEAQVEELQDENTHLKESLEEVKQDIQSARDNLEQHKLDDASDDLDSAEEKANE